MKTSLFFKTVSNWNMLSPCVYTTTISMVANSKLFWTSFEDIAKGEMSITLN